MLRIEGDGSHQNTKVWRDNALVVGWIRLDIRISKEFCQAAIDSFVAGATWEPISRIIISGIYMLLSDGDFTNSKLLYDDSPMRGVQSLVVIIAKNKHPTMLISTILLPNLVEER